MVDWPAAMPMYCREVCQSDKPELHEVSKWLLRLLTGIDTSCLITHVARLLC